MTAATPVVAPTSTPPAVGRRRPGRRRSTVATLVTYAVLITLAVIYIFPFLINLVTMVKTDADAAANPLSLVPNPWSWAALQRLFGNSDFPLWFKNSVIITVVVTMGRVFFNSLAGYALARLPFRGRGIIFAGLVAVMAVPSVVLLIPKFLVVNSLGMFNSYSGLIIPLLTDATGVFIMKNFFESIPVSVEEAARLDGAGAFRTFWSIVLPMATPAVVTIMILSFQGSWNELGHFIVAANDPALTPLTKGVAQLASGGLSAGTQYPVKLAAGALMTIPVAILFFIFQRRIMNSGGGAVKE